MMLHPSIPIRPPASRFLLCFFQPTIGIRYEQIVQPIAPLVAGRRINDARNVAARGEYKARIYPDPPDTARGTFPGFVYQLGNLLASVNATLQAGIASHFGGNYGLALAAVAGSVAIIIAVLTAVGTEAKGIAFAKAKTVML